MIPIAAPTQQAQKPPQYCPITSDAPPKALASNPDYLQFTVSVLATNQVGASLKASDFQVTQGEQRLPIAFFNADKEVSQSVAILIDRSGSMGPKLAMVRHAAALLVHTLKPCDDVFVYAFSSEPIIVQHFTVDKNQFDQRVTQLRAFGSTPLLDSIDYGLDALHDGHYPDRSLVVFTDGIGSILFGDKIDNASKSSREQVIAAMNTSNERVFIVGVGAEAGARHERNLSEFAEESGSALFLVHGTPDPAEPKEQVVTNTDELSRALGLGTRNFTPLSPDPIELRRALVSITSQIDHAYTIGVIASPSATGGTVTITIPARAGARVFSRREVPGAQP